MTFHNANPDRSRFALTGLSAVRSHGLPRLVWVILFVGLAAWTAQRMGAFDLWTTVRAADGRSVRLPNPYATVDHPFHVVRAETLLQSLKDWHPLRWIGHHQGGYPIEFYPLGAAWLEIVVWGVLLGSLPIAAVHKLVVVTLFLLPGAAYASMARRDKLPAGVALLALVAHVSVLGWWWSGGYMELVVWGLITNVAASVALLFTLFWLTTYLDEGRARAGVFAACAAAFAISTNPRSLLPLVVIGVGSAVAVGWNGQMVTARWRALATRLAMVTGLAALLASPVIASLIRFEDLYFFVRYETYADLGDFVESSIRAVSSPVFACAMLGIVLALMSPGQVIVRSSAITLMLYMALTAYLTSGPGGTDLIEQLELTRLMPFQRLLTIYLAAYAIYSVAAWGAQRIKAWEAIVVDMALVGLAGLFLVIYVLASPGWIPESDRGLVSVPTAGDTRIAELKHAVETADATAPVGTALLVLGWNLSWHDQLWAPLWSDRPFFYDDWLWYWQTRHFGPYDPLTRHDYDNDADTLDREYLDRHGIGAVIVTGQARDEAARSDVLSTVSSGLYDVYSVRDPKSIVTFGDANAVESSIANQELSASGSGNEGIALIRRNWFPRWRATVNGESATITQTEDGYMSIPVPDGPASVELSYAVDGWDWLARIGFIGGAAIAVAFLLPAAFRRRLRIWSRSLPGLTETSVSKPRAQSARR